MKTVFTVTTFDCADYISDVYVKVFSSEETAREYFSRKVEEMRGIAEDCDLEVEESDNYFDTYLSGYASQEEHWVRIESKEVE